MINPPTPPTLQTVLDRLPSAIGLPVKTRRDIESAVHVFCRELERQPGEVPVGQIEQLGRGLNAARMGVTLGRLNNVRSLVRRAVAATTTEPARRRLDFPLAPLWARLADLAPDRGDRIILRRLFRVLQLQGAEPARLTPAAFNQARLYLHETGASRPDAIYRKMALAWNRLQRLLQPYRT
jgi:hypothetical protein